MNDFRNNPGLVLLLAFTGAGVFALAAIGEARYARTRMELRAEYAANYRALTQELRDLLRIARGEEPVPAADTNG